MLAPTRRRVVQLGFMRATWIAVSVLLVATAATAEVALDFELKALRFYDFGLVTRNITKSNAGERCRPVKLSDFREKKKVALIFAVSDWKPIFEGERAIERLAADHVDQVQFLLVVVRSGTGAKSGASSELARLREANNLVTRLDTEIPCLIDGPDDPVKRGYAVEGGRVVLVDREGQIAYAGASGQLDLAAGFRDAFDQHIRRAKS